VGINALGQRYIQVTVQDTGSGLQTVQVTTLNNAIADVGTYLTGITAAPTTVITSDHPTGPIVVIATKVDQSLGAQVALTVTDQAGNVTDCDPVLVQLSSNGSQTFTGLPQAENKITIKNGQPGLTRLQAVVNGRRFGLNNLRDNEVRTLDVSSAMRPGNTNTIILRGYGKPGASADVLIWDGKGVLPHSPAVVNNQRQQVIRLHERENSAGKADQLLNWSGGEERHADSQDGPSGQVENNGGRVGGRRGD
jgi:hypothetical protein